MGRRGAFRAAAGERCVCFLCAFFRVVGLFVFGLCVYFFFLGCLLRSVKCVVFLCLRTTEVDIHGGGYSARMEGWGGKGGREGEGVSPRC